MKYTLFKKNDLTKILLLSLMVVGGASYALSAPVSGDTPLSYGDVADLIDAGKTSQSKNCNGTGLLNTTLSLCHKAGTATKGFATEGLASKGPVISESGSNANNIQGGIFASLAQATPLAVPLAASEFHDAVRLTTGKDQNITTITIENNSPGAGIPPLLGVWSDALSDFAEGRFGRLDAEKLILTNNTSFRSWPFAPLRNVGSVYRTVSYTPIPGDTSLSNIDVAGTTNLGLGNYCYRSVVRDCTGGANGAGGGNMYISRLGRNYTSCKDIDPAEFPQAKDMTDPGYFTCTNTRTAPGAVSTNILYMPASGWGYTGQTNLCVNQNYGQLVDTQVFMPAYMSNNDDFYFGTMVFIDPYLERPIIDGWHAGGFTNATELPNGVSWFETKRGYVTRIAKCSNGVPTGPKAPVAYNGYGAGFYMYNEQ